MVGRSKQGPFYRGETKALSGASTWPEQGPICATTCHRKVLPTGHHCTTAAIMLVPLVVITSQICHSTSRATPPRGTWAMAPGGAPSVLSAWPSRAPSLLHTQLHRLTPSSCSGPWGPPLQQGGGAEALSTVHWRTWDSRLCRCHLQGGPEGLLGVARCVHWAGVAPGRETGYHFVCD